jgi:hypothetical protein
MNQPESTDLYDLYDEVEKFRKTNLLIELQPQHFS